VGGSLHDFISQTSTRHQQLISMTEMAFCGV
jgi:hypothetical protein